MGIGRQIAYLFFELPLRLVPELDEVLMQELVVAVTLAELEDVRLQPQDEKVLAIVFRSHWVHSTIHLNG
jgi:hypothetical protein